jgi:hypothetical protein
LFKHILLIGRTSCREAKRAQRENTTERREIENSVEEGNKKGRSVNLPKKPYCSNPRRS